MRTRGKSGGSQWGYCLPVEVEGAIVNLDAAYRMVMLVLCGVLCMIQAPSGLVLQDGSLSGDVYGLP